MRGFSAHLNGCPPAPESISALRLPNQCLVSFPLVCYNIVCCLKGQGHTMPF